MIAITLAALLLVSLAANLLLAGIYAGQQRTVTDLVAKISELDAQAQRCNLRKLDEWKRRSLASQKGHETKLVRNGPGFRPFNDNEKETR